MKLWDFMEPETPILIKSFITIKILTSNFLPHQAPIIKVCISQNTVDILSIITHFTSQTELRPYSWRESLQARDSIHKSGELSETNFTESLMSVTESRTKCLMITTNRKLISTLISLLDKVHHQSLSMVSVPCHNHSLSIRTQ